MNVTVEPTRLLPPFFKGEGGYCQLLQVLLTAETALARIFRKAFCSKVLKAKFGIRVNEEDPLDVRSEVTVHPPGEVSQAVDLVIYLGKDVVGVEAKVFSASARKGQLFAQYCGLRHKVPKDKRVHILFISPAPAGRHKEVKQEREGDQAESITWDDIFACFPPAGPTEPDVILGALIAEAVAEFAVIRKRLPKTKLTMMRQAVKEEMEKSVELFNSSLRDNGGAISGCSWKPNFWRDPGGDSYYGPLTAPDGKPKTGQNLVVEAQYKEGGSSESDEEVRMCIGFRLERKGGVKTYGSEFEASREACVERLALSKGKTNFGEGGYKVFHELWIRVNGDQLSEVAGRPVSVVRADLLLAYSMAFSEFLLRDSRPARVTH